MQRKIEARSLNHCCTGEAICTVYCECVFVALGIQHGKRMHHIIGSSEVCPAVQYFFHLIS